MGCAYQKGLADGQRKGGKDQRHSKDDIYIKYSVGLEYIARIWYDINKKKPVGQLPDKRPALRAAEKIERGLTGKLGAYFAMLSRTLTGVRLKVYYNISEKYTGSL